MTESAATTRTDWITELATKAVHRLAEFDTGSLVTACDQRLTLDEVEVHDELLHHEASACAECLAVAS